MLRGYVVATVNKHNRRYLSRLVNHQPYFANKTELALIFNDRDLASSYAARCSDYTGDKYGVVNIAYE